MQLILESHQRLRRLRARGCAWLLLACALVLAPQARVRAYSSFADYTRSIQEGGGGGLLFTGTPADGHTCEVCHRGAQGAPLEVSGLPLAGYVPGQTYEITLAWPETAPHVALMAEFSDLAGSPVGSTSLAPYATWPARELCEDGRFPAADICRASGSQTGCCRDLEPARDACSFPGERSVLWMLDCGSRQARVLWTAPLANPADVWFSSSMVTSNVGNDVLGDGVTLFRKRLRPIGTPATRTLAVGSCQIGELGREAPAWWAGLVAVMCALASRRRRGPLNRSTWTLP